MGVMYSFFSRTSSVVRGLLALALGVCLLLWPDRMAGLIVKVIAAFLLAVGMLTLVLAWRANREDKGMPVFTMVNVGVNLVFGLLLFLFPNFFLGIIMFLFGAVLLFFGAGQLANLLRSRRYAAVPWGMYVVPALVTVCGIVLFFDPFSTVAVLTAFFGACLAVYGLSELYAAWRLRKADPDRSRRLAGLAEDVPYEEVKDAESE